MADEKTPITIEIPKTNTAAAWNTAVQEGAEKAGVELPKPGAAAAPTAAAKEPAAPTIYETTLQINGKDIPIRGSSPQELIEKVNATLQGAQATAEPAAPAAPAEPKPAFTEAELFDIGLKLQKGDVSALETYITKSGIVDRILESKGLNVEKLAATVTARQDEDLADNWKDATTAFVAKVKAGESDYPGGDQNTQVMGMMLASLGLTKKPSVESFELAYAEMKKRGLVFPAGKTEPAAAAAATTTAATAATAAATTTETKPKTAASSTAVGSHGNPGKLETAPGANPAAKYELDIRQLTPREYTESWNKLMAAGVKPEQIKIVQ